MRNSLKKRLLAAVLTVCTILGMGIPANAASIADGSKTCTVALAPVHTYLQTTSGTWLRACGYDYTTNDGLTGPAYCIDHGLAYTGKVLPITGKYEASAKTAGAFANGYPQHSLDTFLGLHLAGNPVLAGLTEYEYRYATQTSIWATLGQLAVDGTEFTNGRERLAQPSGDLQQERVFCAVKVILDYAKNWDRIYKTGMYIRTQENAPGGNTALPPNMTLEAVANRNIEGIRLETISGVTYYTKDYYVASATSTYPQGYTIDLWTTGAPAGTKFVDERNVELVRSKWHETDTWRLPVAVRDTNLNYNDFEYSGKVKLCIPADNAPPRGEITIHSAAQMIQYEIYLAKNDNNSQQSYICADPAVGSIDAEAILSWGSEDTEYGKLVVTKVGGGGSPLEGAIFVLTGTDGTRRTAKTDKRGQITWEKLSPTTHYTLSEQTPPPGYSVVDPIDLTVKAGQITYQTVRDDPQHTLTVHKQDWQNGYSLRGAVIRFEQIDGSFTTTGSTDHAGNIQFNADELPLGSYRIFEEAAPDGFELDPTPQTVHWDGKQDIVLTFRNVRKPTLIISKQDSRTHYNLPGAVLDVYRDGSFVTSVTTNDTGLAYVPGVVSGSYYTVIERTAPEHHLLDDTVHGIYINAYDPSTTDDPRITIENDPLPSLRLMKYDRNSHRGMESVTFEVFKDGISLGKYQTDRSGEILLQYVEPGTYRAVEVDVGNDSHILDTTPQEIELKAGDDVRELVFFNDRLPGLHLIKVDSADLSKSIPNARFRFEKVGGGYGPVEYTTGADGTIDLSKLPVGSFVVTELECPGYVVDDAQRIIHLDGNETAQFIFTNSKLPSLHLTKQSSDGTPLAGVSYRLAKIKDGSHYLDRTTSTTGEITWDGLEPGVYSLLETATVETHILDPKEYHVELFPGKTSEVVLSNDRRPNLTIHKLDADDGVTPVPNTVFLVREVDSSTVTEVKTGPDGTARLENLSPSVFEISEKAVPSPYLLDAPPQRITLHPNRDSDIYFENHKAPVIEIIKENSITHERLSNVRFQVWYASNNTVTGEWRDLGTFMTNENGRIELTGPANGLTDGWFRVKEVAPKTGYAIKDRDTQEVFIQAGKGYTFHFENTPLSALVIWKQDGKTGAGLGDCTFQLRYLGGGTSGSGGTIIGTYTTQPNGSITVTGLKAGYYLCEEISSDGSHVIDSAPQSVYISGKDQDVAQLHFSNSPNGAVMVKKVSSTDRSPLSDVEFLVTTFNGTVVGSSNGKYVTDSAGSFLVENVEPGTVLVIKETKAKPGYLLDDTPQTVEVKSGQTVTVEFRNQPKGNLVINKRSSVDKKTPLAGVTFQIVYADGSYVDQAEGTLSSKGIYTTDENGQITLSNIAGTVVVTETQSVEGFTIDEDTRTKTVVVNPGDTQTLFFYNRPVGGVELLKVNKADRSERIANVTFEIRRAGDDTLMDTVVTDKNGRVYVSLEDDSYYAVEVDCPSNFKLDSTPHYFKVQNGKTTKLTVTNVPIGGVEIIKVNEDDHSERIPNVTFEIRRADDGLVDTITTDKRGRAYLPLEDDSYYAVEVDCPSELELDNTPIYFEIKGGSKVTKTVTNRAFSGIVIHKTDSVNGAGIYGVKFLVYDSDKNPIGEYTSDHQGYVYIDDAITSGKGKLYIRELETAPGYELDKEYKTVYIKPGKTVEIDWTNTPVSGQIQVYKYAAENNTITGTPAGAPLQGAVYEISESQSGKVVEYITTDARGVAASKPLALNRYKIREVTTPAFWQLDGTVFYETLEYSGQIIKLSAYDKPAKLGVTITKRSNAEVLAGSQMRYDITVSNASNVPLEDFFWHDRIPTDAARVTVLTTGTYSARLNYRILYKTNYSDYRELASNLLTSNNYSFALNAIPMQMGEVVTDVYFDFGKVPVGFQSVVGPTLSVNVLTAAANGYQLINRADAGGKYQGTWQTAQSGWLTVIRKLTATPPPTLPKTGY